MDDFSKYLFAAPQAQTESPVASIGSPRESNNIPDVATDIRREIAVTEQKIKEYQDEINSYNTRSGLIHTHYKKEEKLLKQIEEITKSIDKIYEDYKNISEKTSSTFYSREAYSEDGKQFPVLESNCMRNVHEICKEIKSYYEKEFACSKDERFVLKDEHDKLWSRLEELSRTYPPEEVFKALLHNTKESTTNLKDIRSRIDLRRDAEQLKFKFETGEINDISNENALLQTVTQLVEECQFSHFQKFLATERSKNESCKLKQKLEEINNGINITLNQECNSTTAKQYRKYLSAQQDQGGLLGCSHYYEKEILKLEQECEVKEAAMTKLLKKYDRIKNFEMTTQGKQKIVQQLIHKNSSAKSLHVQQVQDITTYVKDKIIPINQQQDELTSKYIETSNEEVVNFMNVPLQNIYSLHNNPSESRQLVKDLTLHRLNHEFIQPGTESLDKVFEAYNVPSYAPHENILSTIKDITTHMFESEVYLSHLSKSSNSLSDIFTAINGLHDELKKSHIEETESALPLLQQSKQKASDVMTECIKFRNAAQTWWDEPAQCTVPWVNEDGYNLQHYKQQFIQLAQTFRKLKIVGATD